ncbi:MAG: metalloregulator ArsR/SmtB family transcription factor [bacterium]
MNKKNIKNQDDLSKILRAVGDPQRLRLICSLFGKKKECVTQLSKDISLSVASTSYHLRTLYRLGMLDIERNGKSICYRLKSQPILKDLKKLICKYVNN